MFLYGKYKKAAMLTNMISIPSYFSPAVDHSRYHVYTTDSLLSYTCTVVSVCQSLSSELIHYSPYLGMTIQPSGTHLSHDPTQYS